MVSGGFDELYPGHLVDSALVYTRDVEYEDGAPSLSSNGLTGEAIPTDAITPNDMLPATIRDFEEAARTYYSQRAQELEEAPRPDLDSLHLYIGGISCFQQLSKEQEVELAQTIEAGVYARHLLETGDQASPPATIHELAVIAALGDRAYSVLYLSNLALVVSIAKSYAEYGDSFPWLDAIQEGNILLSDAIRRFDYTRGTAFSTYAYPYIDFGLKQARAETTRLIRLPRELYYKAGRLRYKRVEFEEEIGRTPTIGELATLVELPIGEVRILLPTCQDAASLDTIIGEHFRNIWETVVPASKQMRQQTDEALAILTPAQRKIVELFYGLGYASERHSLRDIALTLGYSSSQTVQTTLNSARLRIRTYFENRDKPKPVITHDLLKDLGIPGFDSLVTRVLDRELDNLYDDTTYRRILSLRIATERAIVLLGSNRATVVNRYYGFGFDRHMTKEEVAADVGAPSVRYVDEILRKARHELKTLIPVIVDGSLDLVDWRKQNASRRNVLTYLASIGTAIPDDYGLADLRMLARRHVNEQPIRDNQKEILIKLYGLGDDGTTTSTVQLGREYGSYASAVTRLENKVVKGS